MSLKAGTAVFLQLWKMTMVAPRLSSFTWQSNLTGMCSCVYLIFRTKGWATFNVLGFFLALAPCCIAWLSTFKWMCFFMQGWSRFELGLRKHCPQSRDFCAPGTFAQELIFPWFLFQSAGKDPEFLKRLLVPWEKLLRLKRPNTWHLYKSCVGLLHGKERACWQYVEQDKRSVSDVCWCSAAGCIGMYHLRCVTSTRRGGNVFN